MTSQRRFKPQFSLRTLLVLVTIVGIASAWLARAWLVGQREEAAKRVLQQSALYVRIESGLEPDFFGRHPVVRICEDSWIAWNYNMHIAEFRTDAYRRELRRYGEHSRCLPLLDCFPRLQALELQSVRIPRASLETIAGLTSLRELRLWNCRFDPAQLERLVAARQLRELDLARTLLSDDELVHVAGLQQLDKLHLDMNCLKGNGLGALARLKRLRVLRLSYNPLRDPCLVHLKRLKHLHRLEIWGTRLTEEALGDLRQALPDTVVVSDAPYYDRNLVID